MNRRVPRTADGDWPSTPDVVGVTDQRPAGARVEEHVAEADVAVAQPLAVQRQERVGQLHAERAHGGERHVDLAREQIGEADRGTVTQRHEVAEARSPGDERDLGRPEEPVVRRAPFDQLVDGRPLTLVAEVREVPLQRVVLSGGFDDDVVHRTLAALADEPAHRCSSPRLQAAPPRTPAKDRSSKPPLRWPEMLPPASL